MRRPLVVGVVHHARSGATGVFDTERSDAAVAGREAGVWLRNAVTGTQKGLPFNLLRFRSMRRAPSWFIPYAEPDIALPYLMKERVDYVVLDNEEARRFPAVKEWLAHGISDPNATLIYRSQRAERDAYRHLPFAGL
jgi:hypothetical protein